MSRHLLSTILALVTLTVACGSQPLTPKQAATPRKHRRLATTAIEQRLIAEERRVVWEAVVKKEARVLQDAFDDQFLDVSDVGVFTKAETIKLIPSLNVKDYALEKFRVIMANKEAAIITYEAIQHWTIDGKEAPSHVRASSVWVRRSGRWRIMFHQESTLNESGVKQ